MKRLSFADRLAYALIGVIVLWLVGVNSQSLGTAHATIDVKTWLAVPAMTLALFGFLFGASVGTAAGALLNVIYETERTDRLEVPRWLAVLVFAAVVLAVVWWQLRPA